MTKSLATIIALLCLTAQAQVTPVGNASAGAGATVTSTPTQTTIVQTNSREIINWNSGFNVPAGHHLVFQQPNASAIILNRDKSGSQSSILGNITSNGQVWILNSSGVLFGPNSRVNVAGLLASSGDINNNNFLNDDFRITNATQSVINQGEIRAQYYAVLAGRSITNSGLIESNFGKIALGAGNAYTIRIAGDNLLGFEITNPNLLSQIQNTGTIQAKGGMVYISASQAQNIIGGVVNVGGTVNADTLQNVGGMIQITAKDTTVSGTVTASTVALGGDTNAGVIAVFGDNVHLTSTGKLISQADLTDGMAIVGGDPSINPVATSIVYDAGSEVITQARGIPAPPAPPVVVPPSTPVVVATVEPTVIQQLYSLSTPAVYTQPITLTLPTTTTLTPVVASTPKPTIVQDVATPVAQPSNAKVEVTTTSNVTSISLDSTTSSSQVGAQTIEKAQTPSSPEDANDPVLASTAGLKPNAGSGIKPRLKPVTVSVINGLLTLETVPPRATKSIDEDRLSGSGNRSRW